MHFFISALLQLLDRAGSLYAELARFVLRILFRRHRKSAVAVPGKQMLLGPPQHGDAFEQAAAASGLGQSMALQAPGQQPWGPPSRAGGQGAAAGNWDGLWGR